MIYPLVLDLSTARDLYSVMGRCAWVSAYTVNPTVTPQLVLRDPGGQTRTIDITLPLTIQTTLQEVLITNALGSGILYLLLADDPCDSIAVGSQGSQQGYGQDNADIEYLWPSPRRQTTIGGAFEQTGQTRGGIATAMGLWDAPFGGGVAEMNVMRVNDGSICGRITSAKNIVLAGFPVYGIFLGSGTWPAGYSPPSWVRVFRLSLMWEYVGAALPGILDGMAWSWAPGVAGNFDRACIQLVGNGAGAMQVRGIQVGPGASFTTPINWPVALTESVTVDWLFYTANGVRPAFVELYVNATRVWTRTWASADMPLPSHCALANANKLLFAPNLGGAGTEARFTALRCQQGRFNFAGVPV